MNVLIATFTYSPEKNGVSRASAFLAECLVSLGYDVSIATNKNSLRNEKRIKEKKLFIHEFDIKGRPNRGYKGDVVLYRDFLLSNPFDLIFFECWQSWPLDLAMPLFSKIKGKKILVSHGVSTNLLLSPKYIISYLLYRRYVCRMRKILKAFDHIVFLANKIDKNRFYDVYLANKLALTNISYIPNAIDLKKFENIASNFKHKYGIKQKKMILNVSNYNWMKNQMLALKVFAMSSVEDSALVFIGDEENDYYDILKRKVNELGLGKKVFLFNALNEEDTLSAYKCADLFLFTSRTEVQPFVILDAMASGLPYVSTNVGCVDMLGGGIVCNSVNDLVENTKRALYNELLRKDLIYEGKNAIKGYDVRVVSEKYSRLINEVMEGA